MIRHEVPNPPLKDRVPAAWMKNAAKRTAKFVKLGRFEDASPIWSEVKPVFMKLQHDKCAYCERQLEGPEYGTIEHDLEHFRPKSTVEEWPGKEHPRKLKYGFATGNAGGGYYWLAYDLMNYAAACKVCNSPLKGCSFPVMGTRGKHPSGFAELLKEEPLLCLPIGDLDEDPESLVTFVATTAVPAAKSGARNRRGRVIIDFFDLNGREHLHRDRARQLLLLFNALEAGLTAKGEDKSLEDRLVRQLTSARHPHAGCCRAFERTWKVDRTLAQKIGKACKAYVAGAALPKM